MRKPEYWITGDLQRCEYDDACMLCKKVVPGKTLASVEDCCESFELNYYICEPCARKHHYRSELGQLGRYILYSNFNMWKEAERERKLSMLSQ